MDRIIDDMCIIPDSNFDTYTEKRSEHDTLLLLYLESGKAEQKRHFAVMEEKMDELIRVLKDNAAYAEMSTKLDVLTKSISDNSTILHDHINAENPNSTKKLQKNINKLKNFRGKFLRAKKMANYTDELLSMNPPFVQRKFRAKVSHDTPKDEIESYEIDSIRRAKMESSLLKIRMKRWEKSIAELQQEIDLALGDPKMKDLEISKFQYKLNKNEEVNTRKSLKAFRRVQKSCENELNAGGTQFLLKFIKDEPKAPGGWGNHSTPTSKNSFHLNRHWKDRFPV